MRSWTKSFPVSIRNYRGEDLEMRIKQQEMSLLHCSRTSMLKTQTFLQSQVKEVRVLRCKFAGLC